MKERRIEHIYDCSADVFWNKIFLDDAYNRKLFLEELHFESWRVLSQDERGNEVHRVIEAVPHMGEVPGPIKKLLSDGVAYQESGVLDRAAQRYRLQVTPRSLASKTTISGEMFTTPLAERSCRRTYIARVEARVFGVGGMIEDRLLADIERSYAKSALFTNRWIKEHQL